MSRRFAGDAIHPRLAIMTLTPEPAPTFSNCSPFIWRPGSIVRLTDEPVDRLAEPDAVPAAAPRATAAPPRLGKCRPRPASAAERKAAGAGSGNRLGPGSGANRADAGGAAGAPGEFRRLRAETYRDAAGVRRRQSAGAHHVRRRGPRTRRGYRGPAVCRTLRQIAGPDDRGDRARPQQGLYRQCDSVAAARQPHADAAGDANLPAVHSAADRAGQSRRAGDARQSLDANAAVDPRGHHAHARKMVRLRHRHAHHPRHRHVPPGLSVALAVLQADVLAGSARDREGAGTS